MKNANATPATRTIDLTQDVFETRKALLAAHAIISELTSDAKIAFGGSRKLADWRFTLPSDAQNELAALTAKASALDALVACCEVVAARCVLDDDRYYHENDAKRFYAALSAAKAAQVSK